MDASGELPNGEKFKDVHGLKAALMKQERQVAASLFEGLLCYALGRDVSFTDRPIIEKALNELEKKNIQSRHDQKSSSANPFRGIKLDLKYR